MYRHTRSSAHICMRPFGLHTHTHTHIVWVIRAIMSRQAPLRVGSIYENGINLSDLFLVVTCSVQSLIILTVKGQLFRLCADWMEHHCTAGAHSIYLCQNQVHSLSALSTSLCTLSTKKQKSPKQNLHLLLRQKHQAICLQLFHFTVQILWAPGSSCSAYSHFLGKWYNIYCRECTTVK